MIPAMNSAGNGHPTEGSPSYGPIYNLLGHIVDMTVLLVAIHWNAIQEVIHGVEIFYKVRQVDVK